MTAKAEIQDTKKAISNHTLTEAMMISMSAPQRDSEEVKNHTMIIKDTMMTDTTINMVHQEATIICPHMVQILTITDQAQAMVETEEVET